MSVSVCDDSARMYFLYNHLTRLRCKYLIYVILTRSLTFFSFLLLQITRHKVPFRNTCEAKKGREIENQKRAANAHSGTAEVVLACQLHSLTLILFMHNKYGTRLATPEHVSLAAGFVRLTCM